MNVLVIGGTGMISGPVAQAVRRRGHSVTIFHRGTTKLRRDANDVREMLGDRSDAAIFAATLSASGPWDSIIDMIGGTEADAASLILGVGGHVGHVIACSTTSVYARPFAAVPPREDAACAPTFPYSQNKHAYEQRLRAAAEEDAFALTVVRPAHTYNETGSIIHSLGRRTSHLDRLIHGRPVVVHDDGLGIWSLAWADDIADAIAAAVGNDGAKGRTYHLSGADPFTWDEYHRAIAKALNAPEPNLVHVPAAELGRLLPDRTQQCLRTLRFHGYYDCTAAREDLGYQPNVHFIDGLARNVRHLRLAGLIEPWQDDIEYEQLTTGVTNACTG